MRYRYVFLVFLALMYVAGSSAAVYGTVPYNLEQRSDDLTAELRLGVVNTGDRTLEMEFEAPETGIYNVSMPEDTTLPPVEVSTDPEGGNWKYLGNGKYARMEVYSLTVEISRYRDSNRIDIPLQVTVSPAGSSDGGSVSPVSQVTTHNYTVLLDPTLIPLDRDTRAEKEVYWEDTGEESLPEDWRQEQEGRESTANGSKEYKSNETEQDTGEGGKSGVNTVTMILVAGIVACSFYLARVV